MHLLNAFPFLYFPTIDTKYIDCFDGITFSVYFCPIFRLSIVLISKSSLAHEEVSILSEEYVPKSLSKLV